MKEKRTRKEYDDDFRIQAVKLVREEWLTGHVCHTWFFTYRMLVGDSILENVHEMIRNVLDQWAYDNGVKLYFIEPGKPSQDGCVESFKGNFAVSAPTLAGFRI